MTIIALLATIFGVASGFANIPQAIKIFKRKSAKDISIMTYSIVFIGAVIWTLYGIEINNYPVLISNAFGIITVGAVVVGWFVYGRETRIN
ncbi:MAG: SemiSWEET family transporter [Candidatus Nanoarchaeia archaeon]|nr:SemiSWEET family transporter [Candidatus Nanoarchaeia archaeon]